MTNTNPLRILHVVGGMNRGGIETWLMQVLRRADRNRLAMNFVVHSAAEGAYDREIRRLGAHLFPCLSPARPWEYAHNFHRILADFGPFDAVHSHVHHFNGFVLRLAEAHGIRQRICHSHNDTLAVDSASGFARRGYLHLSRRLLSKHATRGLAASERAAAALFGAAWRSDPRWRTLMYSIDLAPFEQPIDRASLRRELGLAEDALVIGHVGRFVEQKNHRFLLQIFHAIARREPRAFLVLVGDGPLRTQVSREIDSLGLNGRVLCAGLRSDVPHLMRGVFDLFLFPSLFEGLGLVLVEAQAAGLPCVLSDVVPAEANLIPDLMTHLKLEQPAAEWADLALARLRSGRPLSQNQARRLIEASPFNIDRGLDILAEAYAA